MMGCRYKRRVRSKRGMTGQCPLEHYVAAADAAVCAPGGVQRYMEAFPGPDSLFRGSLFVFDERVSVPTACSGAVPQTVLQLLLPC